MKRTIDQCAGPAARGELREESRMTPAQRVERILKETVGSDLSSWEKHQFLPSIKQRTTMTDKQEQCLRVIEKRIFGEDDDGE